MQSVHQQLTELLSFVELLDSTEILFAYRRSVVRGNQQLRADRPLINDSLFRVCGTKNRSDLQQIAKKKKRHCVLRTWLSSANLFLPCIAIGRARISMADVNSNVVKTPGQSWLQITYYFLCDTLKPVVAQRRSLWFCLLQKGKT